MHDPAEDPTPLTSARAVVALLGAFDDHQYVHEMVTRFATWGQFAAATPAQRTTADNVAALNMAVPSVCPDMPPGVRAITRYDETFPPGLLELTNPPVAVFVDGPLPTCAMVAVDGARHPSPQGVEIARSAALAATTEQVPLLVPLAEGVALCALRTAVSSHARTVVVVPHALVGPTSHRALLEDVLNNGGALLSLTHPAHRASRLDPQRLSQVVAALAQAVVLAEVGVSEVAGVHAATAAIGFGRYLIVPAPTAHHLPATAAGLEILTHPRKFSADLFGTSARIAGRVENARTPADAVVSDQAQIATAISISCGQR